MKSLIELLKEWGAPGTESTVKVVPRKGYKKEDISYQQNLFDDKQIERK